MQIPAKPQATSDSVDVEGAPGLCILRKHPEIIPRGRCPRR